MKFIQSGIVRDHSPTASRQPRRLHSLDKGDGTTKGDTSAIQGGVLMRAHWRTQPRNKERDGS